MQPAGREAIITKVQQTLENYNSNPSANLSVSEIQQTLDTHQAKIRGSFNANIATTLEQLRDRIQTAKGSPEEKQVVIGKLEQLRKTRLVDQVSLTRSEF